MMFPKGNGAKDKKTSNTPTNVYGITFKNIHVLPNDMTIYRKLLVIKSACYYQLIMDLEISEDFRPHTSIPSEKIITLYGNCWVFRPKACQVRNSWGTDFADEGYFGSTN